MSFSNRCKAELLDYEYQKVCCLSSHIHGFMCFFTRVDAKEIHFNCENEDVMQHLLECYESLGIQIPSDCVTKGRKLTTLRIVDPTICDRLLTEFGFYDGSNQVHIRQSMFSCNDCVRAFMAGAFLASGSISEPAKSYHLEISTSRIRVATELKEILEQLGFEPKLSKRSYTHLVYFKDSQQIEDFLTYIGATDASVELMQEKIIKDVRNTVTRRVNCENSNIRKTTERSVQDINLFQRFFDLGGEATLTEELAILAKLRIDNPEYSLAELATYMEGEVTKSGINHRLRRLREIATEFIGEHDKQ